MAYVGPAHRRQGLFGLFQRSSIGYPLLSSNYKYTVQDVCVDAVLTETYKSQHNVASEVLYIFEVPPEASVIGFSADVGDTHVEAIVEEKKAANKIYKEATSAGVEAWKLDKVNEEVFQISLGNILPSSIVKVNVHYAYVISSDITEDSVRLTIPCGLAARPGEAPAKETTIPTAPTGSNAVTITVGIHGPDKTRIGRLYCLSHHATITSGFCDSSFKNMTPVEEMEAVNDSKGYVEFTSDHFLSSHFVLVWTVPRIDLGRCLVEKLESPIQGQPQTHAFALTLVSNIDLEPDEHEYIFLVDKSGSMGGSRIQTANDVVKHMLDNLPTYHRSMFNIYSFSTTAKSLISDQGSLPYDPDNVSLAKRKLCKHASGGTDIATALKTVLNQRDTSHPRCSIIVITDGLDWSVKAAMRTVREATADAAAQSKLLRVFVMGLGDHVSRGMCEALARVGSGATAYVNESQIQDHDHRREKAETLINAINCSPIRVRSIDWGVTPKMAGKAAASGQNHSSRPRPKKSQLGPAAKGQNLAPPKPIQQVPQNGTMFWAVRSTWYAIIDGTITGSQVRVTYDIPGELGSTRQIVVDHGEQRKGRLIHSLAARALIGTLEDSMTNKKTSDYWKEAEIIRLGKTYNLASTQTSFVATMNGVGFRSGKSYGDTLPSSDSNLWGDPHDNGHTPPPEYEFIKARNSSLGSSRHSVMSDETLVPDLPSGAPPLGDLDMPENIPVSSFAAIPNNLDPAPAPSDKGDELSQVLSAQNGEGAFDADTIKRVVFRKSNVPPVPTSISTLEGGDTNIKEQIWFAICVMAYLQKRHSQDNRKWLMAGYNAHVFVMVVLGILSLDSDRSEEVFNSSMENAQSYFESI
ncbi:hypothetical protein VMCG_09718 [Cytospora schulzeri]|uniref:VWFA domain-containing protein n=1 Tax=Cytospora schulzeri TaxID=448051 RepID=A0A423VH49_9PEZI|nr:hypothetical protein VMCG_09718 [Valsa malicola]